MIVDEIALLPKKVRENLNFTSFTRNYSVPIQFWGVCAMFFWQLCIFGKMALRKNLCLIDYGNKNSTKVTIGQLLRMIAQILQFFLRDEKTFLFLHRKTF